MLCQFCSVRYAQSRSKVHVYNMYVNASGPESHSVRLYGIQFSNRIQFRFAIAATTNLHAIPRKAYEICTLFIYFGRIRCDLMAIYLFEYMNLEGSTSIWFWVDEDNLHFTSEILIQKPLFGLFFLACTLPLYLSRSIYTSHTLLPFTRNLPTAGSFRLLARLLSPSPSISLFKRL